MHAEPTMNSEPSGWAIPYIFGCRSGFLFLVRGGAAYQVPDWWQAAGLLRGTDLDRLQHALYNSTRSTTAEPQGYLPGFLRQEEFLPHRRLSGRSTCLMPVNRRPGSSNPTARRSRGQRI